MFYKFLRTIIGLLNESKIDYMITGSVASTYYSEPRMTRDIDLVIDLNEQKARHLTELSKSNGFYSDDIIAAARQKNMCNILDTASGWKADLIVLKEREFSQKEFQRRKEAKLSDITTYIACPEDIILSKIEWSKQSQSATQKSDIVSIFKSQDVHLDSEYLFYWAEKLGILNELNFYFQEK